MESTTVQILSCASDTGATPSSPLGNAGYLRNPYSGPFLPPELWSIIFAQTHPPRFLIDYASYPRPKSIARQAHAQKLTLLSVCRTWYQIALPLLYNEVHIWHVNQLRLFVRTLNTRRNLPRLVKSFTICAFISPRHEDYLTAALASIFHKCTNITTFGSPTAPLRLIENHSGRLELSPEPFRIARNLVNLHLLHLTNGTYMDLILFESAPRLVSLSYHLRRFDSPQQDVLVFTNLVDLTWVNVSPRTTIPESWSFPQLQSLTLGIDENISLEKEEDLLKDSLYSFLVSVGSNITYLHFYRQCPGLYGERKAKIRHLDKVLPHFPRLRHLVLHSGTVADPPLTHPGVQWIDIWQCPPFYPIDYESVLQDHYDPKTWHKTYQTLNKTNFPSLQGVRIISEAFISCPNIPRDIPPESVLTDPATFSFEYYGRHVRHTPGLIDVLEQRWVDDDADSSGDYAPAEYESEREGSYSEPDSEGADDQSDGGWTDDPELDRNTLLKNERKFVDEALVELISPGGL